MRPDSCYFFLWVLVLPLFCTSHARADVFAIPSSWRAPSFTDLRETRQEVAHTAIAQMMQNITSNFMTFIGLQDIQATAIISYIATAELASGTNFWKDPITQMLLQHAAEPPFGFATSLPQTDVILAWSIASFYAYRAYNDPRLLDAAEHGWTNASTYIVTQEQAAARRHPYNNFTISSSCQGHTTAGGMFKGFDPTDSSARPGTVGQFVALSAHLAEETKNETYTNAAILSAIFLRDTLSGDTGVIHHGRDLVDCSLDASQRDDDSGFAMHAWSILADVTNDDQWRNAALKTLLFSTTNPSWINDNGIVISRADANASVATDLGSKGQFVGSLYEPWMRNRKNGTITSYIEAFLAVQYNALQTLATKDHSGFYNADWRGPPISSWTPGGVLASTPVLAIAVVPAAVDVGSSPSNANSTDSPNSEDTDSGSSSRHIQLVAVVGGVVGGLIALALATFGVVLLRRRLQQKEMMLHHQSRDSEVLGPELEKYPNTQSDEIKAMPYLSRKHHEPGYTAHILPSQVPQPQETVPNRPNRPENTPNVPVADIVELVYQRLQAERPPYTESHSTTTQAPTNLDTSHQISDLHGALPAYGSGGDVQGTSLSQVFHKS